MDYMDKESVKDKTVYTILGIDLEGKKDILGLWISETESAKYWLKVLTELLYLATQGVLRKWTVKIPHWNRILAQLSIHFGERVTKYL